MLEGFSIKYLEHPLIWSKTVENRLYQKRIAETASKRNTLVILPTALGKTVISAIVAANMLYNFKESKILVMAPTRPLIMQHRSTFMRLLKLRKKDAILLTGKTLPEYRRAIWASGARIFFSTPQVVRNDLLKERLTLKNYSLLVFDECHRAVKRYAYTRIAKLYISQANYPLILGMTASPGSDLKRVLEVCKKLYIERVEYRTEEDIDVKSYIQRIDVEWKRVDLPIEYLELKSLIKSMLNERLHWLYNIGLLKHRPKYITKRRLLEAGDELRFMLEESVEEEQRKIFMAIINQSLALTLFHMLELLETQGIWTLKAFLNKISKEKMEKRSYRILVNDQKYQKLKNYVDNHIVEHPKLGLLQQRVKEQINKNPSSRMLVFTQYRDTASHLVAELDNINGVRVKRFVGQTSKLMDKGLTQEEQAKLIQNLKEGVLNVLVATSIAEEGLDIPAVDHVIFYEPIPSEIRYIQRRGRTGRKSPGKVTILVTNQSLDMIYLFASIRRTEKMKGVAKTVNSKLQPIIRKELQPTPNPMTEIELRALEKEAMWIKEEPEILENIIEERKKVRKKVKSIAKSLYLKLLESGAQGANLEQTAYDLELEVRSINVLKSAIEILLKQGLITEIGAEKYAVSSAVKNYHGKTYKVNIEKIYSSVAVVRINDKWRARLTPQDYNGPRNLIKKNSKFTVLGNLYRANGVLCLRVKDVIRINRTK